MAGPLYYDRVKDTTATTGTGTWTLANSPPTGSVAFSVVGNGNTCYYVAYSSDQSAWEVGLGTYSTTGPTLARTTILASSNAGSAVNFAAGPTIELVTPAAFFTNAIRLDATANLTAGYTATSYSLGTVTSGTTTLSAANGNVQHYTNGGAHTLAPQSSPSTIIGEIVNNASAGAITVTGFTRVVGAFTTTNAAKFQFISSVTNSSSVLYITQVV